MNSDTLTRRIAAAVLIVLLVFGPVAAIGKNGKKFFKEGLRLELSEKWDQAAEQFALALNQEPGNPEYQVHYRRSLVKASLAFMDLGRHFEESRDWSSAYKSYVQAYSYDAGNEEAKIRMKLMLDKMGIRNNNGVPMGKDLADQAASDERSVMTYIGTKARPDQTKPKIVLRPTDVSFQKGLQVRQVIQSLARSLDLNVLFDDGFKDSQLKDMFELRGETAARALDLFLLTNKLFYAQVGIRTIVVSSDVGPNRQRYQDLFVKTFYVRNADINEVTRTIQAHLGTKAIGTAKNLNAIIVRETAPNMQVIESILAAVDKNPAEVLIDVNIYEIAHSNLLQLGNQFATDGSNIPTLSAIATLFGPSSTSVTTTNPTTGQTSTSISPIFGQLTKLIAPNIAVGIPPSTISFLQNKGQSKLLHSTQMRAFENEDAETKVGSRIPIQTAQIPVYNTVPVNTTTTPGTTNPNTPTSLLPTLGNSYPQIQYEDIGLVIKMTPKITTSGDVHLKMSIVSTGVQNTNTLTPTITQRSMTGTAQIKDGQTSLIAGVLENSTDDARSGMPFVGWLPVIGNLFTTPTHRTNQTDIIVTVTPHVIRSAGITTSDTPAVGAGNPTEFGAKVSITEIIEIANNYVNEKSETYKEVATTDGQTPKQNGGANVETKRVNDKSPDDSPEPGPIRGMLQTVSGKPSVNSIKPTDELDESDTTEELNGPVSLLIRGSMSQTRVGQRIAVGIIASGPADLKRAKLTINYNPGVLTFSSVSDGGLFRQGGIIPDLKQAVGNGEVSVEITRPDESKGIRANGQLFIFYFDVTGPGDCELTINNAELTSSRGQSLQVNTAAFKILAIQ